MAIKNSLQVGIQNWGIDLHRWRDCDVAIEDPKQNIVTSSIDVAKLWSIDLHPCVLGPPKYCHANFTYYFTHRFWSNPSYAASFKGRDLHPVSSSGNTFASSTTWTLNLRFSYCKHPPMESHSNSNHEPRFKPISDRIVRALRHRLWLLHRSGSSFFIFGATGNVYTVTLSNTPSCSCPDRTRPCKHILFVYIRVLGVSLDDVCLRRRSLRPCQLQRLLGTPSLPEAVAGGTLRQRFHQLFGGPTRQQIEIEVGASCPVCLEEMEKQQNLVACGTCRNPIHEECLMRWKRSSGRRSASCVICRARWRDRVDQHNYLNLSAYVNEDLCTPSL
ncbi:hypothetical protein VNO78_01126 [Psophocarpus tetragonolobus]|uniref:Mitogen-activated protein kinase kinase kinase 1 n=1 Tax=Psophocarpus tetragonolobus TaxID=3891 RepID=A0AAN9XV17_PSOTE